jgi:hypothetical protein
MKTRLRLSSLLLVSALLPAAAAAQGSGPRIISGAGAVDYSRPESLAVGQYARYVIRETISGVMQEYEQTLMVTGFETYGSEKCVCIETEFKEQGGAPRYCRTLVSLAIAGQDSGTGDYTRAISEYQRRILSLDRPGADVQDLSMPKVVRLDHTRQSSPNAQNELTQKRDSLPATDVVTVAGKFHCVPARFVRDYTARIGPPDGARRLHTQHEEMVTYRCPDVPLTGTARQTHRIRAFDGMLPAGAPADYQPPGTPKVTDREIVLVKRGRDGKSGFPSDARIVPYMQPAPDAPETPGPGTRTPH